jgi:hypothetical protein
LQSRGDRCMSAHPAFIGWNGVLLTFIPGWPQILILPISASWVARIIAISYLTSLGTGTFELDRSEESRYLPEALTASWRQGRYWRLRRAESASSSCFVTQRLQLVREKRIVTKGYQCHDERMLRKGNLKEEWACFQGCPGASSGLNTHASLSPWQLRYQFRKETQKHFGVLLLVMVIRDHYGLGPRNHQSIPLPIPSLVTAVPKVFIYSK